MKNQAILFFLSIDVSIMIAATGCSRPLQSIEFCHAQARPFERKGFRGRRENPPEAHSIPLTVLTQPGPCSGEHRLVRPGSLAADVMMSCCDLFDRGDHPRAIERYYTYRRRSPVRAHPTGMQP